MKFNSALLLGLVHLGRTSPTKSPGKPVVQCPDLKLASFPDFDILQSQSVEALNFTLLNQTVNICNLTLTLRHHDADDTVITTIWLPLDNWNGRFLATGGGGLSAGNFDRGLIGPVALGYAGGSTDAGLTLNGTVDPQTGKAMLRADGTIDQVLLENFAHRSVHDMTVIGKAAVKAFYGTKPHHSYYSGCSQGGRQGYAAAQAHPKDYDGIMANAPAIYSDRVSPGDLWGYVAMLNGVAPPQCVFEAYQQAIVEACDPLDGVRDGLISIPDICHFDTRSLVGQTVSCGPTVGEVKIIDDYADTVARILEGSFDQQGNFLWYGVSPGAPFSIVANTNTTNGQTVALPFTASDVWVKYFIFQDPTYDTSKVDYAEFARLFYRSVELYYPPLGIKPKQLRDFGKAGGKLLTWHGMADGAIPFEGSTKVWSDLRQEVKDQCQLDDFYRLFLAPGAGHCSGGYGPVPVDPLATLVDWVENCHAPEHLFANATIDGNSVARNLCHYPQSLHYDGKGDITLAESFSCA